MKGKVTVTIELGTLFETMVDIGDFTPDPMPLDWKEQIRARDNLDLVCITSYIASLLYPDEAHGRDRQRRLMQDHPDFMRDFGEAVTRRLKKDTTGPWSNLVAHREASHVKQQVP